MSFLFSGRCLSRTRLDGKTAVITGCNTGIGKINALDFFKRGCKVIMACRNVQMAETAAQEIIDELKNQENVGQIVVKHLDLSSFSSVRKFANQILEDEANVHILVNNAGVMLCPKTLTEDGLELQMQTNHFAHFLLTLLLLPKMVASSPARIVNVSSVGHKYGNGQFDDINWQKRPYNSLTAYGQSKLANIYFTSELARRLNGTGVTVYAVHPGYVKTELGRHMDSIYFPGFRLLLSLAFRWFMKTPEQGAQTQIYCAVDPDVGSQSGLYYADCRQVDPYPVATNAEAASRLWDMSVEIVKQDFPTVSGTKGLME